jgi:hypothetical protein
MANRRLLKAVETYLHTHKSPVHLKVRGVFARERDSWRDNWPDSVVHGDQPDGHDQQHQHDDSEEFHSQPHVRESRG